MIFSFVFAVNRSATALAKSVSLPLFLLFDITKAHSVSLIERIFQADTVPFDSCRRLAVLDRHGNRKFQKLIDVIFFFRILRTEPNKTSVERRIQINVATVATVWSKAIESFSRINFFLAFYTFYTLI